MEIVFRGKKAGEPATASDAHGSQLDECNAIRIRAKHVLEEEGEEDKDKRPKTKVKKARHYGVFLFCTRIYLFNKNNFI